MPRVSLLVPAFNSEETILRALDCAQLQTLTDIEIIVIDDASTDRTAELVLDRRRYDARIRLCRRPTNGGPAAARNMGLAVATGEWIALLDADDTMAPDRLARLLSRVSDEDVLLADNLDLYDQHAGRTVKLGIDPMLIGPELRLDCEGYVARCKTNQPSAVDFGLLKPLIRASHIRKHDLSYDESMRYGEDFRFYLDTLLAGGYLRLIPEAYYRYTERTGSISGKRSAVTKTCERYDRLEAQTRALACDPKYGRVAGELNLRADAIRRLAKIAVFGQRSRPGKVAMLPVILADRDMRGYLGSRIRARAGHLYPSHWSKSTLLRDASNLCVGQGIKLVLQGIYFLFIARCLGPSQYGAFIAVTAMTGIISPYVGLGCGSLFLKNVRAGRRTAQVCWGNGLATTAVTGVVTGFVLIALAHLWLPAFPIVLVGAICLSDLILMRVIDLASFGFAASGKMSKTAVQNTTMSLLRVIGIVVLATIHHQVSIEQWTWVYLLTGIIGAAFALQQGTRLWGTPSISFAAMLEDAREGSFFSISTSAQTIYNDIDKTMLAHLSTFSATGVYGAAYRIIDTSLTPVRSLVSAAYPQFFRVGTDGLDATYSYAKRLIRKAIVFGAVDFVGLMLLAPLLPHILGPKYAAVGPAVRLLALIPVMRCVHWFLADALSGANAQGLRTLVQVGVAALNIGLNILILPRWSWVGAAWTSLASDAVLMVAIYGIVQWKLSERTVKVKELVHAIE
jgi:O-antigen/teichoic acid export membrane protein/glycosyltransferase involved in cell wall biosynthesis